MPAAFHTFLCRTDNIGVLIHDEATGSTASVDVPEAEAVERALREKNWRLTHIIVTHRHLDHIEGIPALKAKTGARVIAPKKAAAQVPQADELVGDGDKVKVGELTASVLDTPGHCADHISYWFAKENALFAGDTIFTLGCGRVSEATPSVLWSSLQRISALPDNTRIWSGHEYTLSNAKFALSVDGNNETLKNRYAKFEKQRAANELTVPTTLAEEKATNPFLRAGDPKVQKAVGMAGADASAVFAELRERKNRF
ncbi:MAG: hydroxyacylglutathione hydrolase [Hyphomicrobiales bacterium]|nr:hydroxyacylglutathione hydrolase [Hyphomicrobiales bacterium]MBV9051551.1 hydroxyacylglutathione hydrolase [Hyphomicrobiales bacterium]MBV9974558.1 hydroxyacylglutathione hydrolase [Hyphomicrobiales bacterium]